jgi:hypothetical protein
MTFKNTCLKCGTLIEWDRDCLIFDKLVSCTQCGADYKPVTDEECDEEGNYYLTYTLERVS